MSGLTLTIGILLLAGALSSVAARWLRLPKVALYIIAGLMLGPSMLAWIPEEHLKAMDPVVRLALALVLFDVGSRFPIATFRRILPSVLPLSAGELLATFTFVALGLWIVGARPGPAVLLGALALATAPATTIVVLREYNSEGPLTSYTYALVALNNLAAIVVFELLFVLVSLMEPAIDIGPGRRMLWLAVDLAGSTLLGILGGLMIAYAAAQLGAVEQRLAIFAILTAVLGVCEQYGVPYLLTFLAMGATVANTSQLARQVVRGLDQIAGLLYVLFFLVAGAELDVRLLSTAGVIGTAYIVLRTLGKYLGVGTVALLRGEPPAVRRWQGCTLIAQAGAAIGLVRVAEQHDPQLGQQLKTIIVGTVVFFEIAGPILTGIAVVRAGEVPIAHVVRPYRPGPWEILWEIVGRIRGTFGADPWRGRPPQQLMVRDLMRRNVGALGQGADFLEVLDHVEQSRNHVYPVVDEDKMLVGVIRYRTIRSALFDREVARLVRAEDLCVPAQWVLLPEQSLDEALKLFEQTPDDTIPVVAAATDDGSPEGPKRDGRAEAAAERRQLVGLVERRDVVRFVRRRYAEEEQPAKTEAGRGPS